MTESDAKEAPAVEAQRRKPTALNSLRERIERAREERVRNVPVPYLEQIIVRYRAVGDDTRQRVAKAAQRKRADALATEAAVLIDACVGIFEWVDGDLVSIDPDDRDGAYVDFSDSETGKVVGAPLTFSSSRFQELVGTQDEPTVEAVRALYVTEGDLMSMSRAIFEFSGYTAEGIEDEALGN